MVEVAATPWVDSFVKEMTDSHTVGQITPHMQLALTTLQKMPETCPCLTTIKCGIEFLQHCDSWTGLAADVMALYGEDTSLPLTPKQTKRLMDAACFPHATRFVPQGLLSGLQQYLHGDVLPKLQTLHGKLQMKPRQEVVSQLNIFVKDFF